MKKFLHFLFVFLLTLFVLLIHFTIAYTLPYPYDKINILFIYLTFFLLFTQSGTVVWVAFLTHIFIEVFPSTIFGVTLLSSSLAFLFSYWLYIYYIINRKWYGATTLVIFTLIVYRILYSVFLFFGQKFTSDSISLEWRELWQLALWELLVTSIFFIIIYFFLYKFSRNFHRAVSK